MIVPLSSTAAARSLLSSIKRFGTGLNGKPSYISGPPILTSHHILLLASRDGDAGKAIFRDLIEKLGSEDKLNRLRISIITGVSKAFPNKYGVLVGSNLPDGGESGGGREIVSISRIHHMDNQNPMNLKMFQERFTRTGKFRLMPAHSERTGSTHLIQHNDHHEEFHTNCPCVAAWR